MQLRFLARTARLPILTRQYSDTVIPRKFGQVQETVGPVDVATFRRDAFEPARPLVMRATEEDGTHSSPLPALGKWIKPSQDSAVFTPYIEQFSSLIVPYELVLSATALLDEPLHQFLGHLSTSRNPVQNQLAGFLKIQIDCLPQGPASETRFLQFDAPLGLMIAAFQFNENLPAESRLKQLYIAQAPLNTLPTELQEDVPAPKLVREAGKGDVYDSSVWIGLEPTYTPWHRDPNPNLFYQLWSSKEVRLLPPRRGEQLYLQARAKIGQSSNSRIRGPEMMEGAERQALLDAVWSAEAPEEILRVCIGPSDALFIPKGWWHSVRSNHDSGCPNASVNWWFR